MSVCTIPFMCICLDQSLTLASADDLNRRTGVLQFPSSSSKTTRILGIATVNVCLDLPSGKDDWPHNRFSETNKIPYYIPSIASNVMGQFRAQWKAKELLHESNMTIGNSFSCSDIYTQHKGNQANHLSLKYLTLINIKICSKYSRKKMGGNNLCYLLGNQIKVQPQKGSTGHQSQLNF